jgi:hypothetical protein
MRSKAGSTSAGVHDGWNSCFQSDSRQGLGRVGDFQFDPANEGLFVGTPMLHPTNEDLFAGTPVLHPTNEDLFAGTPVTVAST